MISALVLAASQAMTFSADRIAADNVTHALAATGHLVATCGPVTIRGESATRSPDGLVLFDRTVCATTCTNDVDHTHWNVTGEVVYKEHEYVILRDAWLELYEVPILWLPYLYYPLETDCGFSWMPGYTGHWGGYLLTKYAYHLLGDARHDETKWWLDGATRLDLRYRQGVALGEDLSWNLGDFGDGLFNFYYAWDEDARYYNGHNDSWHNYNWGSPVDRDRYMLGLTHRWEATERDTLRVQGSIYSDSFFRNDFCRTAMFNWKSQFLNYESNGVFWDHLENDFSFGGEVSGRLNKFYGMTGRLPEFYFDLNPRPLFGLPINYETENRFGYLSRSPAEFGRSDRLNPYCFNPGPWADYEALRFDTYHRLTAPFRTLGDVLAVVPRVGFHGTGWNHGGKTSLSGWEECGSSGPMFRTILESGATFAGRGTGWVDRRWQHVVEPYLDVLAQQAWVAGARNGSRPYVFDSVDASMAWEDQFAGRSRNLPYSYYGATPGVRNAWEKLDERGHLHQIVDFDVYAAMQFNDTSYVGDDDGHKLARAGRPNYGKRGCFVAPGARLRWTPDEDIALFARGEYDSDNNRIATSDVGWNHRLSDENSYYVKYALRDYRWWDFSSAPYDPARMTGDEFNYARVHNAQIGFQNQPIDWLAWGPYLRWDIRENEMDGIGSWFDYLTDCLGFRFIVEYQNAYTRIDGYERDEDWSFGFYIYLRAFGADSANLFK